MLVFFGLLSLSSLPSLSSTLPAASCYLCACLLLFCMLFNAQQVKEAPAAKAPATATAIATATTTNPAEKRWQIARQTRACLA